MESSSQLEFDYLFRLLLIGDSGVGKSSLLLILQIIPLTIFLLQSVSLSILTQICVDFKVKYVTLGGKKLKLERFRTLTSSYYRGAQGIIMGNLSFIPISLFLFFAKEIDLYSTNQDCIKMLVGNKVDRKLCSCCFIISFFYLDLRILQICSELFCLIVTVVTLKKRLIKKKCHIS
ncbi:hypothetical protein UlMin_008701 [Ulmus minor]